MSKIRFSSEILRRLGEELNPNIDQGVLELAKNAYDADARIFEIEIKNASGPGGTIDVHDDGYGMSPYDIENGWLVLGASEKGVEQLTPLGRRPSGSKGLGRLAALRVGTDVRLVTRPKTCPHKEFHVEIDWNRYEEVRTVDEVDLPVVAQERVSGLGDGTHIEIRGLRHAVNRHAVKRLARALILLADPFDDSAASFSPRLNAPEFSDIAELVQHRYFDQADYHLIGEVDAAGAASARVVDWKGDTFYQAVHRELADKRDADPYRCPPARFDLWAFILNQQSFAPKQATVGEVREWLQTFGGVHIYQNGIRVSPYGNPGNDWLEMNLRRAQVPEERPSTNTSIGRVAIDDQNGALTQKTDRSGFVESEAFEELRDFAHTCLEWMGRRRLEDAEKRRARARAETKGSARKSRASVEKAIEEVKVEDRPKVERAFRAYDKSRQREVDALRREVQLYRTLSTVGITTATFAHESHNNPIKVIGLGLETIERRARRIDEAEYESKLREPLETIRRSTETLSALGSTALKLVDHGKRRQGRVSVNSVARGVLQTFRPFLKGRDVDVQESFVGGEVYLHGSEAAVESLITNLLNNAVTAFEESGGQGRTIRVGTEILGDTEVRITVEDSGGGIQGVSIKDMWLPGQTTRQNGTGLGLTIVRDTALDLGGRVEARESSELGGACFMISLPIIGVEQ